MSLARYPTRFALAIAAIALWTGHSFVSARRTIAQVEPTEAETNGASITLSQEDLAELERFRSEQFIQETVERSLANSTLLRDRIDEEVDDAMMANQPPITALFVVLALLPILGAIAVWLILNRLETRASAYAQELESLKSDAMSELTALVSEAQSVLNAIQREMESPLPVVSPPSRTSAVAASHSDRWVADAPLAEEAVAVSDGRELLEEPDIPQESDRVRESIETVTSNDGAELLEDKDDAEDSVESDSLLEEADDAEESTEHQSLLEEADDAEDSLNNHSILEAVDENDDERDRSPHQNISLLFEETEPEQLEEAPPPEDPQSLRVVFDAEASEQPESSQPPRSTEDSDSGASDSAEANPTVPAKRIPPAPSSQNGISADAEASAREFCRQGNALFFSQRYPEAISAYDRAIELKPDYYQAWSNRGSALFHRQRYEAAIESYDRALELKFDYPEAWNNRGGAMTKLRQFDEALTSYDRAVQLKPDYVEAWNNRGLTLMELGRYQDAVKSYNKAVKQKPDYAEAWNNRGLALAALERHEQALPCYAKAAKINPNYSEAWKNRGASLSALDRDEEAEGAYDRAVSINDRDVTAWYYRGQILAKLKRYDEAISAFDRASDLHPSAPDVWYNKACCYSVRGFVAPAIDNLQEALRLAPHPYRERAQVDSAFDGIREDERFKQLINESLDTE
ncbi:MAG: tetratricopeptide repeat protein [Cyanobacteria bacterium SID2]|nr:tetratricopeptide repeat protein [Cyanobacteria bacterium SID2]MBP0004776.1 tetratricopeptide repeat protein [Cyanobacteria bacterium SBC]